MTWEEILSRDRPSEKHGTLNLVVAFDKLREAT
jgi:hypothetical protein